MFIREESLGCVRLFPGSYQAHEQTRTLVEIDSTSNERDYGYSSLSWNANLRRIIELGGDSVKKLMRANGGSA